MLRTRAVATILAGAVLLAGCSSATRHQAGADEPKQDERLGELRIGVTAPMSVDPALLNPTHTIDVLATDLLYDGLTAYDAASGDAMPELASSWDTADGVTWTFHLDPERKLSDGSALTSAQVVASIERVRAAASTSLGASRLDGVASVSAAGDDAVQIVLAAANYELPALLADPTYGIVPNAAAVPTMSSQAVVSGRFRVKSGGPDGATLVAVDGDGVGVDAIEFVHVDSIEAARKSLGDGDIDVAPLGADGEAPDGSSLVVASAATLVLELGTGNGAWKDAANRTAVLHSIDRDAVAVAAVGDPARRADSLVPAGVVAAGGCATGCAATPEGAAALGALGASSGPVPVDVALGERGAAAGTELVRQLVAAGLPAEVRPTDSAALQSTLAAGQLQMALFVVVGASPTPDPYLSAVLSSIGSENLSGYASPEFDAALAAARGTADATARRAAYLQLEATALADAPVVPLVKLGERYAVAKRVKGVSPVAGVLFDGTDVRLTR